MRLKFLFRTGEATFKCDGTFHRCYPDDGGKVWIDRQCDCIRITGREVRGSWESRLKSK